jgi:chemotaxis protein histidine kinase CheA
LWDILRSQSVASPEFAREIKRFCGNIVHALEKPWLPAAERRKQEQLLEKARQEQERNQVEQEARQAKEAAAAAKKAEEKRKAAEVVAARRADEEQRKQQEAETKRRAAQEQRRLKDAAEAKARAVEESQHKQDVDRLAREKRREDAAAAKRAYEEDREVAYAEAAQRAEQERLASAAVKLPQLSANVSLPPPNSSSNWVWWVGAIGMVGLGGIIHWVGQRGVVPAGAPTPSAFSELNSKTSVAVAPAASPTADGKIVLTPVAGKIWITGTPKDNATSDQIKADLRAAFGADVVVSPLFIVHSYGIDSLCWSSRSNSVITALKKGAEVVLEEGVRCDIK